MLGLAKREVVTERVDALLKIGLGPLGMVNLRLGTYWVSLRRNRAIWYWLGTPAFRYSG